MRRKNGFIIVILTLALLLGWHYFFRLPFVPVGPFEGVSNSTAIVFSFTDGQALLRSNTFSLDSLLGKTLNEPHFQTDLTLLQQTLGKLLQKPIPILVSLQNPGSGRLAMTAIADIRGQSFDLDKFLAQLPSHQIQPFYYQGRPIYRVILKSRQELTVARFRNLLLIAPYPLLVEEAINRLMKPFTVLTKQTSFKPLSRQESKEMPFTIFVNVENIPLLLADWLQPSGRKSVETWGVSLQWWRIEPQVEKDAVKLKGALTTTNNPTIWKALGRQQPKPIGGMMRVIPDNIAFVQWMSLSNPGRFFRNTSDLSSAHLEKYVVPWAGDELSLVRTQEDRFVVIKIKKSAKPENQLDELGKKVGELATHPYGAFTIRQLIDETLLEPLFGKGQFLNPAFATIEDYVVFASSRSGLEVWIDQYMVNKTMGRSNDFLRLYQKWKAKSIHSFVYLNMVNFAPQMRSVMRTQELLQNENLEQLGQIGMILNESAGKWKLEGYWNSAASALASRTNIAWKTLLDYDAITPPMLIGNGTAEEPYAIALQDTAFQLYLLNTNGKLLWKKKLENRILSTVQAINYFKSGASQLIFNTPNNLYLLDRNGTAQGTFPLHLQTPATNGVTVVDFDGNEQYSFFMACANGSIYGFDQLGRPLQGWNPLRGVGEVQHPVVHFQNDGKDYLLVLNEAGRLFAYRRDGNNRFGSVNLGKSAMEPPQVQLSPNSNRIVVTDKSGTAHVISLEGTTFKLPLQTGKKSNIRFAFADIAVDERKDYVAMSDTTLTAHHYEGNKFQPLYNQTFAVPQRELLTVRVPGREKALIGTVSAEKQQVFLLQEDGHFYPDFPLAGTTRFFIADLFNNGQHILVVANGDSVYAYRVKL